MRPVAPTFRVIDGTPEPEGPRKRMRTKVPPSHIIRCPRCTGLALIEVWLGMEYRHGKATGGQKARVCAICLARGEYVIV
jgi:hypothetical protein